METQGDISIPFNPIFSGLVGAQYDEDLSENEGRYGYPWELAVCIVDRLKRARSYHI